MLTNYEFEILLWIMLEDSLNSTVNYGNGSLLLYALTWDDIFKSFEIKHKPMLERLKYDESGWQMKGWN